MVIRTYFDRNNTIFYNNKTNVGLNPIAELIYGGSVNGSEFSRFIFQFDESRIQSFFDDKTFADITKLKHTLRMTNTGAFDKDLLGKTTCGGKRRASSFDLILFPITQDWDEGVGYDFGDCGFDGESSISLGASNWFEATSNMPWSGGSGVYASGTTILGTQHFEHGNENIEIDVTDVVNGYLTGDTNYGLGLAFEDSFEAMSTNERQYVGFFTRHTQTFYEPFIETTYDYPIKDDRANFYLDKTNKLYLYSNLNGEPTNLDSIPSAVIIMDNNGDVFTTIPSSGITQVTKGVYCVEVNIPTTEDYLDCSQFTDIWSGITINGINRPDVELDFIVKASDGYFNIGSDDSLPKQVGVTVTGIRSDERINRGDIRKVIVSTRIPYTINQKQSLDSVKYRLYVKEGRSEYTVIDFQDVNMANNYNYFLLDTASLVPGTYYLDIKTESNQEVNTIKNVINFDITSQVDFRNSQ